MPDYLLDQEEIAGTLRILNQQLIESERKLTNADGLPRRPWYKHLLYAPGVYTGYDVKTGERGLEDITLAVAREQ